LEEEERSRLSFDDSAAFSNMNVQLKDITVTARDGRMLEDSKEAQSCAGVSKLLQS
jgi:hypothetical protein